MARLAGLGELEHGDTRGVVAAVFEGLEQLGFCEIEYATRVVPVWLVTPGGYGIVTLNAAVGGLARLRSTPGRVMLVIPDRRSGVPVMATEGGSTVMPVIR